MRDGTIEIGCEATEHVSLAYHENATPVVREIVIRNGSAAELRDVAVRIESRPPAVRALTLRLDRIAAGASHHIATPDLRLDAAVLAGFTEASRLDLAVTLTEAGGARAETVAALRLLPPSHWGGGRSAPELLAAFVRPNDPAVDVILRDAATKLAQAGRATGLDGYTTGTKTRVWELAEAIWAALADRRIAYVLPPASFEQTGQKVRGPSDVLERRVGTCLDLSLLYAACLEQAGLHPLLVLTTGHAFVGLWLKDEDGTSALIDDMQTLRKRRDLEDVILVETTLLTHTPPALFAAATSQGGAQVEETAPAALDVAIDVRRCRRRGIRPLDLGNAGPTALAPAETASLDQGLSVPPRFQDEEVGRVEPPVAGPVDRLETWKRKLLDLTLRNKLLNFKPGKGSVILDCSEAGALEDRLAAGHAFRLLPSSDGPDGAEVRSGDFLARRPLDDVRRRDLAAALARGEVHTTATEGELDRRLLDLYRLARNGFEEGGANILFLAVGFLSWTRKPGEAIHRAPLLLIPVALQRSSVRAGFRLALHDDEIRINPTLLELLREDFRLRLPELEGELPRDASGIDVEGIFRIVRGHVRDLRGWEVVPDIVLSAFSFTKYLMWKDLVDRADLLKRNPVVRHLIETPKHAYGDGAPFPEPGRLDAEHPPETVFAPLSADSSQLSAVIAAGAGKDFVLFGPPGTGKSQTIGNMIAQCLAQGRTVLFVSQKTAALEVVQRRLNEIGLGDHCLEVHSTKAQKSSVLAQLRKAWHERASPPQADWHEAAGDLAALRDELNRLVTALHRRRENGMSAYEGFGHVVAAGATEPAIALAWPDHSAHDAGTLARLRAACRDLRPVLAALGSPVDHPLRGIAATQWSPVWRAGMAAAIAAHADALTALRASGRAFADAIGLGDLLATPAGTRGLVVLDAYLVRPEAPCGTAFLADTAGDLRRAVAARERFRTVRDEGLARLAGRYRASLLDQDLPALLAEWVAAQGANFLVRGGRLKRVQARVQPYVEGPAPADLGPDLIGLIEVARHIRAGCPEDARLASLGAPWNLPETGGDPFRAPLDWAEKIEKLVAILAPQTLGTDTLRDHLVRLVRTEGRALAEGGHIARAYGRFSRDRAAVTETGAALACLAGRDDPQEPIEPGPDWIAGSLERIGGWTAGLGRAQAWCAWQAAVRTARDAGLGPLIAGLEAGRVAPERAEAAFEAAYARWWIDRVVSDDPVLARFLPERHEDSIARFRAADIRVSELSKRVVRARLGGGVPAPTAFGADPEWGTLSRELTKKTAHLPLRKLFARMPSALTRLTPCVMMSPLSIAQYLPPDSTPFDVVIFDEASQISPWDAIGAIARGKQVVIVGDPEQLPPTNVGDRGVDAIEDGSDVADQESILDECLAANIPRRNLDWHYRSRHESLIAFSNARYYGGRLVTFPSPVTDDRAVRLTLVRDGLYERGAGRVKRPEARAVVTEIVRRLREPAFAGERRSLGIVTFNGEQQHLIENLLDEQRRAHPELEPYFDRTHWHEPVFVKNLENVQGDERDAILFSVAVGPDATGRVGGTVSSLNKEGGYRRLNVAITRARRELVVFASLRPEQIDLGRTGSRGVRDFKHFLEFAERGPRALAEAFAPTGGDVESPFEAAVMAALEARGWSVHTQIGVSGFRIDLGIVHPDAPGRYLAGIECDGATYHRSATARDRDRLREQVLVDLGWRIRRVWSTDWWMDAGHALDKLDGRLREDLETDRRQAVETKDAAPIIPPEIGPADAEPPAEEPSPESANDPLPEQPQAVEPARPYADLAAAPVTAAVPVPSGYRLADPADLGVSLEPARFHEAAYRPVLAAMIAHVLAVEAPIYEEILVRRVSRAHGIARVSPPVRDAILDGVDPAIARTDDEGRALLWPPGEAPCASRPHRPADPGVRSHAETPMPELVGLAETLPARTQEADRVRLMARALGLSRLEATTRARFERALARAGHATPA
ncbi:DUF3320 domain-containing protein [Methylobacterium sp. J-090]|uniref:DUF3320 domain-containing protein n=1 Tax=Methylobacterium sp. J-090 TaxID=2836666 RepID=UPI001FB9487B|nr:DUF3320 domain-containing protein [Methylobacterium sp. J-090]MCJ2084070.1 DUF3320 domain-containing protein [Methylobacterium sp. J-090]